MTWEMTIKHLNIGPSDLEGPLGMALYAGKLRATLVSKVSGDHVSLKFDTALKKQRWRYNMPITEAERVFISVANSRDNVGTYFVNGNHAGKLFPTKNWHTGKIVADPSRFWVAERILMVCADIAPLASMRYEIEMGNNCLRCGAELDEPESIAARMGPKCREVVSALYGTRHQRKAPVTRSKQTGSVAPEHPGNRPEPVQEGLFVVKPGESLQAIYERLARS